MAPPSPIAETMEYSYTPTVQAVIDPEVVEIKEEPKVEHAAEPMTSVPEELPCPLLQMPVPCSPVYVMHQEMVITSLVSAFAVGCLAGGMLAYLFSKPDIVYVEQ